MNQINTMYNQIDITTSNPLKIVLMLYDGAVNFLNKAVSFAENGNIKEKNIYANKARSIIEELNNSLNLTAGEDLARQLRSLYLFMNRHLMQANWNNDVKAMKQVVDMLSDLKEAWQSAYTQQENQNQNPLPGGAGIRI